MDRALAVPSSGKFRDQGLFFQCWRPLYRQTLERSSGDGSQQAGSNTAIKSFWRWTVAEIWPFLPCYVWDLVCVMCCL